MCYEACLAPMGWYYFKDDYIITGISPGQRVIVGMNSNDIDAFLLLINLGTGAVLNFDDDGGDGFNSRIIFNVQDGVSYLIRASSAFEEETGSYTLSTQLDQSANQRSIVGSLTTSDDFVEVTDPVSGLIYFDIFRFFVIGQTTLVIVTMDAIAPGMDPFLIVLNEQTEEIVGVDDDGGVGLNSLLSFTAEPGVTYLISPSTVFPNTTGDYRLTVSTGFLEEIDL